MNQIKTITVYASSSTRSDPRLAVAAEELGLRMAQAGVSLIFGGGGVGLMGSLYEGARAGGGRVIGITTEQFVHLEQAVPDCDELVVVKTMAERKTQLLARGDAIIVLPGGLGTYEEFFEAVVARVLGHHVKPLVLANIDRTLDPLLAMIDDGIQRRLISGGVRDFLHVRTTPEEALHAALHSQEELVDPGRMVPSGDWGD